MLDQGLAILHHLLIFSLFGVLNEVMRVNLLSAFLAVKHAAPGMAASGGGSIVMTASAAGFRAGASGAAYSASKAGIINLVQRAASELAAQRVRVNAVSPGVVETGMTRALFDDPGIRARIEAANPMGRTATAEEVAYAGPYLASDESAYVTGAVLPVDGAYVGVAAVDQAPDCRIRRMA